MGRTNHNDYAPCRVVGESSGNTRQKQAATWLLSKNVVELLLHFNEIFTKLLAGVQKTMEGVGGGGLRRFVNVNETDFFWRWLPQ